MSVLVWITALALLLSASTLVQAAHEVFPVPPPRACNCTDVYPHVGYNAGVVSSCLEMQRYKKCGEPFMMNAIKELPEGYCQVTCGRCSCCKPLWDTMQGMSDLSMFRDYASAVGLTDDLKNPGIMWTVLAPTNPAMEGIQSQFGPASSLSGNKDAYNRVLDILKTHILLPYDLLDALWTTPFMTVSGAKMATVGGSTLYGSLDGGDTYVHAGRSKTKVAPEYVEACKAIIIKADSILYPPGSSQPSSGTVVQAPPAQPSIPVRPSQPVKPVSSGEVIVQPAPANQPVSSHKAPESSESPSPSQSSSSGQSSSPSPSSGSCTSPLQALKDSGDFTKFISALQKVGYEDKLESTSTNWTVLAPRDWALEGFQKDHGDLLSDTNKLRDLIKYHILTSVETFPVSGKTQVSTLLGPQLTLSGNNVSGPKGGADVVKNNIGNVCSGSVQELDWVLIPPSN